MFLDASSECLTTVSPPRLESNWCLCEPTLWMKAFPNVGYSSDNMVNNLKAPCLLSVSKPFLKSMSLSFHSIAIKTHQQSIMPRLSVDNEVINYMLS